MQSTVNDESIEALNKDEFYQFQQQIDFMLI